MSRNNKFKAVAVGACCAAGGAIAGIAGAGAAPSSHTKTQTSARGAGMTFRAWRRGVRRAILRGDGPAVHVSAVVLNRAGTGFITATEDRGTVQSVNGDQLTVKEAIGNVTYKTVTVTIPAGATVYRNFAKSSLTALKSGDHVGVAQSSDGTFVMAGDGTHGRWGRGGMGAHPGWPGPRGQGGPPGPGPGGPPGAPPQGPPPGGP